MVKRKREDIRESRLSKAMRSSAAQMAVSYVAGPLAGAVAGAAIDAFSPKQMTGSVTNKLANRAVMKRTHGKPPVKRKPSVKVSSQLRKKINKVVDGGEFKGTYRTCRQTNIGNLMADVDDTTLAQYGSGGLALPLWIPVARNQGSDAMTWWAQGMNHRNMDPGSAAVGLDWMFFSPLKFLDAASILWNGKVIAGDYMTINNNLTTAVKADGGGNSGTEAAQATAGQLKLHVLNSYVTFELKNNSKRRVTIRVYHCTPKMKEQLAHPLTDLTSQVFDECGADDKSFILSNQRNDNQAQKMYCVLQNPNFRPGMSKTWSSRWSYEEIEIQMQPGEICTHSVQGPKNEWIDYGKMFDVGTNTSGLAAQMRGRSVSVMMAVIPDLAFAVAGGDQFTSADMTGRFLAKTAYLNMIQDPISMEVKEHFSLGCPKASGFLKSNTYTAGSQALNYKVPRIAFGAFTTNASEANLAYDAYNEENPADAIAASRFN